MAEIKKVAEKKNFDFYLNTKLKLKSFYFGEYFLFETFYILKLIPKSN